MERIRRGGRRLFSTPWGRYHAGMSMRRTSFESASRILLPLVLGLACGIVSCQTGATYYPAPGALGPYSGSTSAQGLLFVSGKIGETGGSFEAEVDSAIDAVAEELGRLGLALADVVSATVYLTDMESYRGFNEIYARRFPRPYPARACVAVQALPGRARVEIQVIARR